MLVIICGSGDEQYLPQRRLIDTSWDATVGDIASGQFEDVSSVIHTGMPGRDVLPLIAEDVRNLWADREEPLTDWQRTFIERNLSVQAANRFGRAA